MNYIKKRDKSHHEVIDISEGFHLVLAPPGCGKTDILADRINQVIKRGVSPQDMLWNYGAIGKNFASVN